MSEPWCYNHIHEKPPKNPHRVARIIVGVSLVYVFALMGTVELCREAKDRAKSVKRRLAEYNKSRRSSNE